MLTTILPQVTMTSTYDPSTEDSTQYRALIKELTAALEQLLDDGLVWSSEHDAEIVLRRARKYLS